MKTIIYNIGTLAGILPEGTLKLEGRQMNHVECIEDAYLVIEDGVITGFGHCPAGMGVQNRATPLAAGGGARSSAVGGVVFKYDSSRICIGKIILRRGSGAALV